MRLLFLDDDENRINRAKTVWKDHDLAIAKTADEAIKKLKIAEFDVVHLDHDLGGMIYMDSGPGTGYEVAQYISTMKNPPKFVVIHSWNSVGAKKMLEEMSKVTKVIYEPFHI